MSGPLAGIRVVEIAGLGPGPFCGMLLADMGADVVLVDRLPAGLRSAGSAPHGGQPWLIEPGADVTRRGKRSIAVDLKSPAGAEIVLRLAAGADALFEGFRPGVAERLGIGPAECLARNGKLVYGRITGWGQHGPLAGAAGHDIDYVALAGALYPTGAPDTPPIPPLNLIGDYGGGGMLLAFGLVCGVLAAGRSGRGQVVDAAMVDGAALLTAALHSGRAAGWWSDERGTNLLDGAAPFYRTYECKDGQFVAVGALESQFTANLLDRMGISPDDELRRGNAEPELWPKLTSRLTGIFRTRTRDEWCSLLTGDCCVAPVLSLAEAPEHEHNTARGTFLTRDGVVQPAPAPRFDRTPVELSGRPPLPGADCARLLGEIGYSGAEIEKLVNAGIAGA
jgi:alpha-methylacyl-CoA racemase